MGLTIVLIKVRKARYFAVFVYLRSLFIIDGFIAEFNLRSSSLIYLDVSPFNLLSRHSWSVSYISYCLHRVEVPSLTTQHSRVEVSYLTAPNTEWNCEILLPNTDGRGAKSYCPTQNGGPKSYCPTHRVEVSSLTTQHSRVEVPSLTA